MRLAAGVGLWDKAAAGAYLTPLPAADATHPGGSGGAAAPAAFFNVAFRTNEPVPTIGDVFNTAKSPAWWRDKQQGAALASGDISAFHADVDFAKLASARTTTAACRRPARSTASSRAASRPRRAPTSRSPARPNENDCTGPYQGQLQPYAVYVPKQPKPARGYGLTLLLHSLSTNYNQFTGSRNQSEFGERGAGSIVITPEARGPDGSYASYAAADVFEVWADVARHYQLDPDWTSIAGYSMGGIGTFKLAEQFPDLFARAQPTVGDSTNSDMIASLRNIPVLMWNGAADELVNPALYLPTASGSTSSATATSSTCSRRASTTRWRSTTSSTRPRRSSAPRPWTATPRTSRSSRSPALDLPKLDYVSDHAYWLSGVKLRDAAGATGRIDVLSHGFGAASPTRARPRAARAW